MSILITEDFFSGLSLVSFKFLFKLVVRLRKIRLLNQPKGNGLPPKTHTIINTVTVSTSFEIVLVLFASFNCFSLISVTYLNSCSNSIQWKEWIIRHVSSDDDRSFDIRASIGHLWFELSFSWISFDRIYLVIWTFSETLWFYKFVYFISKRTKYCEQCSYVCKICEHVNIFKKINLIETFSLKIDLKCILT